LAEFVSKGGNSTASLKSVCENVETKEPASGGDVEVKEQTFK
jgi:hypothetical protein